jgi:hypothetical protein
VRRTTLAVVLATGALSVPAVALAAGNGDTNTPAATPSATPTPQQQPDRQAPKRGDCPNHDGGESSSGGGSGGTTSL